MDRKYVVGAVLCSILGGCGSSGTSSSGDASADAHRDSSRDSMVDERTSFDDGGPADRAEGAAETNAPDAADAPPQGGLDAPNARDGSGDAPGAADSGDASSGAGGLRWVALPAPQGASIAAVAIDSDGTLYAGADDGAHGGAAAGLFRSTDDGTTWHPINVGVYDFHVDSLFADGPTVYAGTAGLLRSTNRGDSWMQVTPPGSVGTIAAIGEQGNLAMVASSYGGDSYYTSQDGGKTWQPSRYAISTDIKDIVVLGSVILRADDSGVTRSTDGGVTFGKVQGINNSSIGLGATLACDGAHTCYANANNAGEFDPPVLLKSVDAGATWTPLGLTEAPVVAVSDTGILYVQQGQTLARSDDGGASFSPLNRPTTSGAFEPNCAGPYAARGDRILAGCGDGVYRSLDKGTHWQALSGSTAGRITGFADLILADDGPTALGSTGDIYVVGNHGRTLQRSSDGGWTWQTLAAPFFAPACVVTGGGALECAGVQINPTPNVPLPLARSEDHGATWKSLSFAQDGGASSFSPIALAAAGSVVYAVGQGVARSDDDGRTFQLLPGGPSLRAVQILRSGHLLGASSAQSTVYRSKDQGASWQPLPRAFALPVVEDGQGRLLSGLDGVSASTDEGGTWNDVISTGAPLYPSGPMATDGAGRLFLFGPGTAPEPYYGSPPTVFVSSDGGSTWAPATPQIPNPNWTGLATDKQGHLLVATSGGVFRLEDVSMPGAPQPDAGTSGSDGGVAAPPPRPLTLVLGDGPWSLSGARIAVDSAERVYRSDDNNVYVVDAGAASTWLTRAEVAAGAGLASAAYFDDIDVGTDGAVYAAVSGNLPGASTSVDVIAQSNAAHQATLWRNLGTLTLPHLRMAGAGKAGLLDRNGFSIATTTSTQLVYASAELGQSSGCPIGEIAIDPTGTVAFPLCTGAVKRGTTAGGALSVMVQLDTTPISGEHVACFANDPAGGFFFLMTDDVQQSPRLYHVAPGASGDMALAHVVTEPSFGEVRVARSGQAGQQEFASCVMATAPNGSLYVSTLKDLWKVAP